MDSITHHRMEQDGRADKPKSTITPRNTKAYDQKYIKHQNTVLTKSIMIWSGQSIETKCTRHWNSSPTFENGGHKSNFHD